MPIEYKLPQKVVYGILILSFLPLVLLGLNVDLSYLQTKPLAQVTSNGTSIPKLEMEYQKYAGAFLHVLLEWSSFAIAITCSMFSLLHFRLKKDVTTPIIGASLFCAGMLDCFLALAASRIMFLMIDPVNFFPFTWALTRIFVVLILMAGTLPFLSENSRLKSIPETDRGTTYFLLIGALFMVMSYAIVYICAYVIPIPTAQFANTIFYRPWDVIPLILMLLAVGIVFPRFFQHQPSVFSHSLIISMVPAITGQVLLVFGSSNMYDSCFYLAYYLKILSYAVPMYGLMIDYTRAYGAELLLQKTSIKLEAAKQIQQRLLPTKSPKIKGFEVAGCSHPAEAVGGDYFDYVIFKDGRHGVLVGDVSGHDLGSSLYMTQTRAYLRALLEQQDSPEETITKLNQLMSNDKTDTRFVTFFLLIINPANATLEYIGAGHQGYHIKKDGSYIELGASNPPLGISEWDFVTDNLEKMSKGDFILIPTDGIFEATNAQQEPYGFERMMKMISTNADSAPEDIVNHLYKDVTEHTTPKLPEDDITAVLVKKLPR